MSIIPRIFTPKVASALAEPVETPLGVENCKVIQRLKALQRVRINPKLRRLNTHQ
jgi:hypothetical protein